jgi:hypothetical protein
MSTGLQLPPRVVSVAICAQRNLSPFAKAAFLPRDPKAGTLKKNPQGWRAARTKRAEVARRWACHMGDRMRALVCPAANRTCRAQHHASVASGDTQQKNSAGRIHMTTSDLESATQTLGSLCWEIHG